MSTNKYRTDAVTGTAKEAGLASSGYAALAQSHGASSHVNRSSEPLQDLVLNRDICSAALPVWIQGDPEQRATGRVPVQAAALDFSLMYQLGILGSSRSNSRSSSPKRHGQDPEQDRRTCLFTGIHGESIRALRLLGM